MYYRIPDEEAERRQANITNVTLRHCRVGKVTPMPPKYWVTVTKKIIADIQAHGLIAK